jgi:hypothetical protein
MFAHAAMAAALLLAGLPGAARAQVFLAADPHPPFSIGPLLVLASVTPELGSVAVRVSWSLTLAPQARRDDVRQDLYLLWPAEVEGPTEPGAAEPVVRSFVQERGFEVAQEGRLTLRSRDRTQLGTPAEGARLDVVASFVTFYRKGTDPAQSGLGTFIKIPWTSALTNPAALVSLSMRIRDLITAKPATWFEQLFWGRRHILTIGAGTAGSVALYAMYLEQREHVVPIARDFTLITASFDDAEHLRIEELSPPAATRRPSRARAGAEVVALPLSGVEGSSQTLKVQFSYFTGRIAWRPVLISLLFLVLGNLMGAFMFTQEVTRFVRRRLRFGRSDRPVRAQSGGVVPAPELLDRIVPGVTPHAEIVALCGPPDEDTERRGSPVERTLIYRETRRRPNRTHRLGWVATVRGWEEERHEVEITLEDDCVRDVQTRIRRMRL